MKKKFKQQEQCGWHTSLLLHTLEIYKLRAFSTYLSSYLGSKFIFFFPSQIHTTHGCFFFSFFLFFLFLVCNDLCVTLDIILAEGKEENTTDFFIHDHELPWRTIGGYMRLGESSFYILSACSYELMKYMQLKLVLDFMRWLLWIDCTLPIENRVSKTFYGCNFSLLNCWLQSRLWDSH